jgi:hypothetical protein
LRTSIIDAAVPLRAKLAGMTYLRARRNDLTSLFWADLAEDLDVNRARRADVPNAIDELARGDISVVCDPQDAEAALAWARAQPYWPRGLGPEHDPLYVVDSNAA